jgi:hypothetical protein
MIARPITIGAALLLGVLALEPASAGETPRVDNPTVRMESFPNKTFGRISLSLRGSAEPELRQVDGGIELHFAKGIRVALPAEHGLHEVDGINVRETPDGLVVVIRFACDCGVAPGHAPGLLRLDIRSNPKPAVPVVKAPTNAEVKPLPNTTAKPAPNVTVKPPSSAAVKPTPNNEASDLGKLREALTAKLAMLNGGPIPPSGTVSAAPQTAGKTAAPVGEQQSAAPAPICPPHFDAANWTPKGDFTTRLTELRAQLAVTRESSGAMAELAEFYLSNGLAGEAFTVASEAQFGNIRPEDRDRLAVTRDIARLLKREALDPDSPLLAISSDCQGSDAALWRALAAAAAGDPNGVARDAESTVKALHQVPEPLLQLIVFRIVDAAGDNLPALQAMAGALRNTDIGSPENEAGRFFLQARMARLSGDADDERAFLERAVRHDRTVPGLMAKARLAAIRAAKDLPPGDQSEALLADIARTYRSEAMGQEAAENYAESRLRQGDYASALAIADETAGPASSRTRDSRGAALVARILRTLMADAPGSTALPDPADRLAL